MKLVLLHDHNGALNNTIAPPFVPLLNKPIAQHQIEQGYASGMKDIALIASDGLSACTKIFGDGTKFGVKLDILIGDKSGDECASLCKHGSLFTDTIVVLSGVIVSKLDLLEIYDTHKKNGDDISVFVNKEKQKSIAAVLEPNCEKLMKGKNGNLYEELLLLCEDKDVKASRIEVEVESLSGNDLSDLLRINTSLLKDSSMLTHNPYVESDKEIFLGRGVSIHPKANIYPPVLIGHHSQILSGASVGPNAVIGDETIVAQKAELSNCVVTANSYIGEMTKIENAIVAKNSLFSTDLDTKVVVTDPFLLGRVKQRFFYETIDSAINRGVALGLFLAFAPLGVAVAMKSKKEHDTLLTETEVLGQGRVNSIDDIVYLPRVHMLTYPEDYPLAWWPKLMNVIKGDMNLIGTKPITPDEAKELDGDWMLGRFKSPPGLTGIGDFSEDTEERIVAENLYAEKRSIKIDAKIAIAKFAKNIIGKKLAKRIIGL